MFLNNATIGVQTLSAKNTILMLYMSRPMGKQTICIGENKGANQLRGNPEADQRLCFRYSDVTVPPLHNSKISGF